MEKRLIFFVPLFLLAMTILDIVVVETLFRPTQSWDTIWMWQVFYIPCQFLVPIAVAWRSKSLIPMSAMLLFPFGIEDTMFYALQGYLPIKYWGVPILGVWEPSLIQGLMINALGISLITLCLFAMVKYRFTARLQLFIGEITHHSASKPR